MALEITTVNAFMGEFGNNMIAETINQTAVALSRVASIESSGEGGLDIINVDSGFGYVANQDDGGALISAGNVVPVQGTQQVSIKRSAMSIPRATAEFVKSAQSALDLLERNVKRAGQSLGRAFGRGLIAEKLVTMTATDVLLNGTGIFSGTTGDPSLGRSNTTGKLSDISGLRAGDIVARYSTSGDTLREILLVSRAQLDPDGILHDVTFVRNQHALIGVGAPANADPVVSDYLQLYTPGTSTLMTDLQSISGSGGIYGISTAPHFVGQSQDMAGAFDELDLRQLHTAVMFHGGDTAGFVLSNSRNRQRYQETAVGRIQFKKGDVLDAGGGKLEAEFDGKPWVVDELTPDGEIYLVPTAKEDLCVRWFRKPKVDDVGSEKGGRMAGMNKGATTFVYNEDAWGACTVRAPGRVKVGRLHGITG